MTAPEIKLGDFEVWAITRVGNDSDRLRVTFRRVGTSSDTSLEMEPDAAPVIGSMVTLHWREA